VRHANKCLRYYFSHIYGYLTALSVAIVIHLRMIGGLMNELGRMLKEAAVTWLHVKNNQ
jgi:hypothetical protein